MLQKTRGIVLRTLKYKDSSLIADVYTEVSGRTSFLLPVSRSRKAPVKTALCSYPSFCVVPCARRPKTVRCLPICSIRLFGWTSAVAALPIFIWFF